VKRSCRDVIQLRLTVRKSMLDVGKLVLTVRKSYLEDNQVMQKGIFEVLK
jgi:hypothetical protein